MKSLLTLIMTSIFLTNFITFAGIIIEINEALNKNEINEKENYDFTKSIILASSPTNYKVAIPLAAKYHIPLILVSEPYYRIQHFLDLYKPLHIYEVGDTPFNGTLLSEEDLIIDGINESNDYVVVAKKNGEYFIIGEYLAALHEGKLVLADSLDDEAILEQLKKIKPRYCALVWNPDDFKGSMLWLYFNGKGAVISKSTMTKFIENILTKIDSDPYIDVSFGFITGSDVTDASLLISREIVYNDLEGEWKNRALFTPSYEGDKQIANLLSFKHIGLADKDYNARNYLEEIEKGVEWAFFFGHGSPITLEFDFTADHSWPYASFLTSCPKEYQKLIEEGKDAVYLPDNLTIPSTIFIMEACLAGLTGNVYGVITKKAWYDCDDFRNHSISLKLIRAGAAAYIASTTDGGVMSYAPYMIMSAYNWSLGDAVKHIDNMFIANGYYIAPFVLFKAEPRAILFGDPAFKPSLPIKMSQEDFYDVEVKNINFLGKEKTFMVSIQHKKNISYSFGKVEINRSVADKLRIKFVNHPILINKIKGTQCGFLPEMIIGHIIEEDHDKIYLCWHAMFIPAIGNHTLKIIATPEKPFVYVIE